MIGCHMMIRPDFIASLSFRDVYMEYFSQNSFIRNLLYFFNGNEVEKFRKCFVFPSRSILDTLKFRRCPEKSRQMDIIMCNFITPFLENIWKNANRLVNVQLGIIVGNKLFNFYVFIWWVEVEFKIVKKVSEMVEKY